MFSKPQFDREKIMVSVRALVIVLLLAGSARAGTLDYLDANFASQDVASGSTGLGIKTLTAKSDGVVWGGVPTSTSLYKFDNGTEAAYALPFRVGAIRNADANNIYIGEYGIPNNTSAIYKVDNDGNSTLFATLPNSYFRAWKMSVSPVNGDVIVNASVNTSPSTSEAHAVKFNSSGVLQWDTLIANDGSFGEPVAYSPSGQAYYGGVEGKLYSLDDATGAVTLLSASVAPEYAAIATGNIHDMVFSSDNNLFVSIAMNGGHHSIVRTNLSTNETELLAHFIPTNYPSEHWLEYVDGQGLYINQFDPSDTEELLTPDFGMKSFSSFGLEGGSVAAILLQGDLNGEFSGINAIQSGLVPEPSSVWLLFGLLAWKRKKLALRFIPQSTRKISR